MRQVTSSAQETRELGARLARRAQPGDVYALEGDLGTGKTEFVRGFVEELIPGAAVRSPTFSIVNTYSSDRFPVFHFDFYRLCDSEELDTIGFDEYTGGDGVCLIEWADMFRDALPENTKVICFGDEGESERVVESEFEF
ncbi:MAG: tRNA (adenosine(37)-N6)-threonylcarbamoyltransferase complex ATPase subunit type 1 TsaE [Chitinispirillaceae bacterium]